MTEIDRIDSSELTSAAPREREQAVRELRSGLLAVAGIEHQLKTAIAIIRGWAETLEHNWDKIADGDRQQAVAIIRARATSLGDDCERLLGQASHELEDLRRPPDLIDLHDVLDSLVQAFDGITEDHAVVLQSCGPVAARVLPAVLDQAVSHLVDNAIKYSPAGEPIVVRLSRARRTAYVDVIDRGPGLQTDMDFTPVEHPEPGHGTGIGLYVAKHLVEAMGGGLTGSENSHGGTTFRVRLPCPPPRTDPC